MAVAGQTEETLLDALAAALRRAGVYNRNDQSPPAAVLWPDRDRAWEPLLPRLRDRLPLLTLGSYNPVERTGPAYWLRCVIAGTLPDCILPAGVPPIIYLPGVSKQEIRAVEECPRLLQPLAELQYRGVLWTQKNGKDWTVPAFLQSQDGGLGMETSGDNTTREAAQRALVRLADEPVSRLRHAAPLRSEFFDALLNPDDVRTLLLWLNDPAAYRTQQHDGAWAAFGSVCRKKYGFDPDKDGPVTAAGLLGARKGAWDTAWRRFAEAPRTYAGLPALLLQGRPQQPDMFGPAGSWPQDNERAEDALREALLALENATLSAARATVAGLEVEHGPRRNWIWPAFGRSPLARALAHLATLIAESANALGGITATEIAAAYSARGWRVDDAVLRALAEVERDADVAAMRTAIRTLYQPWLYDGAVALQKAVAGGDTEHTYPARPLPVFGTSTCIVFCDGLRYDVAQRLVAVLAAGGGAVECDLQWGLTALPSVTATAKSAVSPVAGRLGAGPGLDAAVAATGARVTADGLRGLLREAGYQPLKQGETGEPAGRAWTESKDIDEYGHGQGWKIARHLDAEVRALADRIDELLEAGWTRIVVVTDHGWLLLPGGLPKAELPEHLTEVRKGRCARLKPSAHTDIQTVPWRWDPDVRIALAPGISCFESGREYEHGGLSPQECVVPILSVSKAAGGAPVDVRIAEVVWRGLRCRVTLVNAGPGVQVDVRTKPADPSTSLCGGPVAPNAQGIANPLVHDDSQIGTMAMVVVLAADGTPRAQQPTTVGE